MSKDNGRRGHLDRMDQPLTKGRLLTHSTRNTPMCFTPVPILLNHIHKGPHKQCVASVPFLLFHIQVLIEMKFIFSFKK